MAIKKEVIITGSSGFLGQAIVKNLSNRFKIIGIDKKKKLNNEKNINYTKQNLNYFFKKKNLKNVHSIIHLATAESRANIYEKKPNLAKKNINDLLSILEKIKKDKKRILLIFASSRDIERNSEYEKKNLYSISKEYCENLIRIYSKSSNFTFYIVRFPDLIDFELNKNPKKKALFKIVNNVEQSNDIIIDNTNHAFEFISRDIISKRIEQILTSKIKRNSILSFRGKKINIVKLTKKIIKMKNSKSNIIYKKKIENKDFIFKILSENQNYLFKKLFDTQS